MNYKEFKLIEEYFKLGELIEQGKEKLNALERIKQGVLSINDLTIIKKELTSFGVSGTDYMVLDEIYQALLDELEHYKNARKELKEIPCNINLDKILVEKHFYENEINNRKVG